MEEKTMADPDSITLREFMNDRFMRLEKAIECLQHSIVGKERFDLLTGRVAELEMCDRDREKRLVNVERAIWLLSIVGGIVLAVLTAVIISFVTGSLGL